MRATVFQQLFTAQVDRAFGFPVINQNMYILSKFLLR